jgi:hypothetical protein
MTDIGYWDLMFDQLGPEGFSYTADGNGYTSNVINWNSAVAIDANNEFVSGNEYKTALHEKLRCNAWGQVAPPQCKPAARHGRLR